MKSMLTAAVVGMSLWTGVAAGQPVAEATLVDPTCSLSRFSTSTSGRARS